MSNGKGNASYITETENKILGVQFRELPTNLLVKRTSSILYYQQTALVVQWFAWSHQLRKIFDIEIQFRQVCIDNQYVILSVETMDQSIPDERE
jgi:hypothetical protein